MRIWTGLNSLRSASTLRQKPLKSSILAQAQLCISIQGTARCGANQCEASLLEDRRQRAAIRAVVPRVDRGQSARTKHARNLGSELFRSAYVKVATDRTAGVHEI